VEQRDNMRRAAWKMEDALKSVARADAERAKRTAVRRFFHHWWPRQSSFALFQSSAVSAAGPPRQERNPSPFSMSEARDTAGLYNYYGLVVVIVVITIVANWFWTYWCLSTMFEEYYEY
jgi:hypothetical protein